jgi:hypothetical protein
VSEAFTSSTNPRVDTEIAVAKQNQLLREVTGSFRSED